MARILVLNGPNLNLLGTREPQIYGSTTLADIIATLQTRASPLDATIESFQSNHEGAIVDRIHDARGKIDAIIINPGAFTHTSVALRDALSGVAIPFVEVHISNVHAREEFRKHSYLSDKAVGVICGLGVYGYEAALEFVVGHVKSKTSRL
jgi:3-dehydroquinate dehydratase-2